MGARGYDNVVIISNLFEIQGIEESKAVELCRIAAIDPGSHNHIARTRSYQGV